MRQAIQSYFQYGLYPGSMLEHAIRGDMEAALIKAHPLVVTWYNDRDVTDQFHGSYKQWESLTSCINALPPEAKGEKFSEWIIQGGYVGQSDDVKAWFKISMRKNTLDFLLEDIMRHV